MSESECHKILGIRVNNSLSWSDHITGGLIQQVNRRTGSLKRISYHVDSKHLPQIAAAIVGSIVRYGVAIYGAVRLSEDDPTSTHHKNLQIALNNAMRVASGRRRSERVPISELCRVTGIQSVNRMSAEEKLRLVWQTLNNDNSPLKDVFQKSARTNMKSRAAAREDLVSDARSELSRRNVAHQAVVLWNHADPSLRWTSAKLSAKQKMRSTADKLPL